jgi:hypothetical protein
MPIYHVQLWPPGGAWQEIEAITEQEAAERLCGVKLRLKGTKGELRARVRGKGDLSQATATAFYADQKNSN